MRTILLALCLSISLAAPLMAEQIVGRVGVLDGDTISVGGVLVRLQGVAAPERDEPGGPEATSFMQSLMSGEIVVCDLTQEWTWRRRVGTCQRRGVDVGRAIIEAGLARDCPRYSGGRYAAVEPAAARELPLPSYCERK